MNTVVKSSSIVAKQAFFESCGIQIKKDFVENVYEVLFQRAFNALSEELKQFTLEDLIGGKSNEIFQVMLKYFYIDTSFFAYGKFMNININSYSIKEKWARNELKKIVSLLPEAETENKNLTKKQFEKLFDFFVILNIHNALHKNTEVINFKIMQENSLNYEETNLLLKHLTSLNGDLLSFGCLRNNITVTKHKFLLEKFGLSIFNLEDRILGYQRIFGYIRLLNYYRKQEMLQSKEVFKKYVLLIEKHIFNNNNFHLALV